MALAHKADQDTSWPAFAEGLPEWFRLFVGLEGLASGVFTYETMVFGGQLQLPEYAASMLIDNAQVSPAEAGQVVRTRMARQRLADDLEPLRYAAVIEESILHRAVGGPEVMLSQLRHVLTMMERDNVTLRIMPISVAVHDGLSGPFTVLDFEEARSIGYFDHRNGSVYVQDPNEVDVYKLLARRLTDRALSEADSAALIRSRIDALA